MNTPYVRRETVRRNVRSWGGAALLYVVAFLILLVGDLVFPKPVEDAAGPVRVRLGSPTGIEDYRAPTELPEPGTAAPSPETAVAAPAPPTQPAATRPAEPEKPEPKPEATGSAPKPAETAPAPATQSQPTRSAPATPVEAPNVVKGSEAGNTYEFAFEAGSGVVGRTLYVPIYLYMPLPEDLSAWLLARLPQAPDGSASPVLAYYERSGTGMKKRTDVRAPLPERPRIWQILKDAGYDLLRADYRLRNPKPVTIAFTVTAATGSSYPVATGVSVVKSSGYSELDEAVLYGFAQAGFRNSSDRPERGSFTYVFGSGK